MFEFEGKIRYSETDADLKLTIPALLNYFQDTAIFEGENVSIPLQELAQMHLTWVLNAWQVSWSRLPKINEDVVVGTLPFAFRGFMGSRNFVMKQKQTGEVLASAISVWVLVNTQNMLPARSTKELEERYPLGEPLDIPYEGRRISVSGEGTAREDIVIRRGQIDSNHHVNNAEYVNMALELVPLDKKVCQIRAEYKKPTLLQETLTPILYQEAERMTVGFQKKSGEMAALVEFRYE